MFKKTVSFFIIICCFLGIVAAAYGASSVQPGNKTPNRIKLTPNGLYTYGWRVSSVNDNADFQFGDWRIGPTDVGPGQLSSNDAPASSRNVSVDITGQYSIGKNTIGHILGVEIGSSKLYDTSSYKIPLAAGERKTIRFRPKYQIASVESQYVRINNMTGAMDVLKTETAYVNRFIDWDYDWFHSN